MSQRTSTTMDERQHQMVTMDYMVARVPGHGSFTVTADALAMIGVFGGFLYCHQGKGGCRKQGLYFSRTQPKKSLPLPAYHPGLSGTRTGSRTQPGQHRRNHPGCQP